MGAIEALIHMLWKIKLEKKIFLSKPKLPVVHRGVAVQSTNLNFDLLDLERFCSSWCLYPSEDLHLRDLFIDSASRRIKNAYCYPCV
jgi:hypothetical protein